MTEEKPRLTLKLNPDRLKAIQSRITIEIPRAKAPNLFKNISTKTPEVVKVHKMPLEEYQEMLGTVRRKFAKAFPKSADPVKILKNGIHKDLCAKLGMEENKVWRFLYVYTKKKKYTLSLKLHAPRYDLKGKVTSHVIKEEMTKPTKKKKTPQPRIKVFK